MFRLFFRLAALIFTAAVLPLAGVIILAQQPEPLLAQFETPGCLLPCFIGIVPDQTLWTTGLSTVNVHPWVGETSENARDIIGWEWLDSAPDALKVNRRYPSMMQIHSSTERVLELYVTTSLTFGDLWVSEQQQGGQPRFISRRPYVALIRPGVYARTEPAFLGYASQLWFQPVVLRLADPGT
jgi:hypothetical protein